MSLRPSVLLLFLLAGALHAAPASEAARRREALNLLRQSHGQDDLKALESLARARQLAPQLPEVHFRIGYLYQKMNRRPESIASYERSLAFAGCHAAALNNLANLRRAQNDAPRAESLLRKAIRCSPREAAPYYNLGNLLADLQRAEEAEAMYRQALRRDPAHSRSRHNLALLQLNRAERILNQDDPRRLQLLRLADSDFAMARRAGREDPLTLANHGRVLELMSDSAGATQLYERALQLSPSGSNLRLDLSRRLQRLRALSPAVAGQTL